MAWLRYDVVTRLLAPLEVHSVLEMGCGQGAMGSRLAARYDYYLGVEPDERSCAVARERVEPVGGQVRCGDASVVPAGSTYDLVCAFEVLEHLEDDVAALAAWVPRIRPGGHLLVSVPAWQSRFGPMDERVGHFRRYSPDELGERLAGAGLVEPDLRLYGFPLGYGLEAARNRVAARTAATAPQTVEERTATSGRLFQPRAAMGALTQVATKPFRLAQRAVPGRGTGLVALARRPE